MGGIGEISCTISEGQLLRLDCRVDRGRRERMLAERLTVQYAQHLQRCDPLGIRWHLIDSEISERDAERRYPIALMGCQILACDQPALAREERGNLLGDLPTVEYLRAMLRDGAECASQSREARNRPNWRNSAIGQKVCMP